MQRPRTPGGGVTGAKTAIRLGSAIDRFLPQAGPSLQRLSLTGAAADRAAAALAGRLPAPAALPPAPRPTAAPAPPSAREQSTGGLATTARALKVTLVIDAASLAGPAVPDGAGRVAIRIDVAGRTLRTSLSAKSIRKAVAAIAAAGGPAAVAVVVSGRLEADNSLADAGIVVQPRTPKPPAPEVAP